MSGTDADLLTSFELSDSVACIGLRRPERHNSLVPELLRDLLRSLAQAETDPRVRAVLLFGHGPSFSTGGDLGAFLAHWDHVLDYAYELVGLLNEAILALLGLEKPVVAAVHGFTTGGSLGLALASDAVVAASDARFGAFYGQVGFSPDGGWTVLLPAVVGSGRARACLLLDRPISAAEAFAWGMVTEMVPPGTLRERAAEVATEAARRLPGSLHRAKRLLVGDLGAIAEHLERERGEFVDNLAQGDVRAGVERYLAKMRQDRRRSGARED